MDEDNIIAYPGEKNPIRRFLNKHPEAFNVISGTLIIAAACAITHRITMNAHYGMSADYSILQNGTSVITVWHRNGTNSNYYKSADTAS